MDFSEETMLCENLHLIINFTFERIAAVHKIYRYHFIKDAQLNRKLMLNMALRLKIAKSANHKECILSVYFAKKQTFHGMRSRLTSFSFTKLLIDTK
ncbi:conserved hypothetical protein [Trichinella spiralis]|uniref:hypothetical protein n=1 Tax=Trichinella spiralis TaxID=6334 RepID=UPI0001EFD5D5|nr:conserved hypothetical protein [Trichinella spiralis]